MDDTISGQTDASLPIPLSARLVFDVGAATFDGSLGDLLAILLVQAAKGDLIAHDGTVPAVLNVGLDGQVLLADSSQPTGLRYGDPAAVTGQPGGGIAIGYTFSTTTTDADPGGGMLRLNNATQNLSTVIRADLADAGTADVTAILDSFDDSTNTIKGFLRLVKADDPSKWIQFSVTAVASPSGYRNIAAAVVASSTASPFANGDSIVLFYTPIGDRGTTGIPGSAELFVDLGTGTSFILNASSTLRGFRINPSGNFTIAFISMPAAPIIFRAVIEVDGAAGFTGTYPSGSSWGAAGEPTWGAGVDLVTVYSRDGGTSSRFMLSSGGA